MRHHGRADDADRKQQRACVRYLRQHRMQGRSAPINRCDEHLDEVAERNDGDQVSDDQLDRPEAEPLEHQDGVYDDAGNDHSIQKRDAKQQRQADGAAEEFRQIGCHGGDLADHPHRPDHRRRKMVAAHLRQVPPGHDSELGRKRLKQHCDQVGEQYHPEQGIAVLGAGLDVGGKVAGVHVRDRGDHRRPDENAVGPQAAAPAGKQLARRRRGAFGERSRADD